MKVKIEKSNHKRNIHTSDNWAITGTAFANYEKGNHIITSKIEHPAVKNACEYLKSFGLPYSGSRCIVQIYDIFCLHISCLHISSNLPHINVTNTNIHPAVKNACEYLKSFGFDISYIDVDNKGTIPIHKRKNFRSFFYI